MAHSQSGYIGVRIAETAWTELDDVLQMGFQQEAAKELPLSQMVEFAKRKSGRGLNRILLGAELQLEGAAEPTRSSELSSRIASLRAEQERREYNAMVANIGWRPAASGGVRAPVISGLSFAVTVLASVFASVFLLRGLLPGLLARCAIGLAAGVALMCVEVFLAVRAITKQEGEESERRKRAKLS